MTYVLLDREKCSSLLHYIEDERYECFDKEVEPCEDLQDAYKAITKVFDSEPPIALHSYLNSDELTQLTSIMLEACARQGLNFEVFEPILLIKTND